MNKRALSRHTIRALRVLLGASIVTGLLVMALVIVAPLTYDNQAHEALDDASRQWSFLGDQIIGFDVSEPRQNLFSLARDVNRTLTIVDHADIHASRLLGVVNFITHGSIYTVVDALRLFDISLTARQAQAIDLCKPLDRIANNQPIVIQPDPWQYGVASWYGPGFDGRLAATGEIYHMGDLTAAHRTLPLQAPVRVVATRTGNSVVVRINDRGPYVSGRIIDLSYGAKEALGAGDLSAVYIERLDPTALEVGCQ